MSDDIPNIFLEHIRAIRNSQETIQADIREIKGKLVVLESAFSTLSMAYGNLSSRIDRIELRLERIEKRLELVEV